MERTWWLDDFKVVERLKHKSLAWFDGLSGYCARIDYAVETRVALCARRPMIELAPDGELIDVRFNIRSAGAITECRLTILQRITRPIGGLERS